ncbi:hypothetical protein A3C20_01230 [Candidatus Kaiserbacteria bacterium RIFCSPHIGHO2_02_FULL_55_25]|uniref:Uncharacterized protein n=1 Tax=Candidatus Kaiserbacteria bacterium RIFCSPHIGHO2_02_FULL_55_25 TaxID=1798498 RepID=A0A1F6EAB9_9BACT|nr:MAG: hypothetical protein A2764_00330 [Candidatus Kaiserbacteria bacterium RIFCSPHIGHO2_01_FULL_55_79]OGG70619.1 MAG: hypothetical protein A3C20_01230 [Candidatus Kaiserbacteria bacterium RIFCSPHIGHO2_02_FULL_55_25]OGG78733.1 MAG: hypothetical protein A3F56_00790 [Candidatus Kaiserbacteria bacterium RIFCSPHIGHO2_12_FULL_55_13]OGG82696.1 MAG: hypothetical protein A3A42_02395 [Candidatus Kaiserbacteria bacterium RIFCSPLOWO2_01_FULL_55_25]
MSQEGEPFVTGEQMLSVKNAYHQMLFLLGDLSSAVKLFRVSFTRVEQTTSFGPDIQVFFVDPLGNECSHSTGYQQIGTRSPRPSADEIAGHLCSENCLPRYIREHLARGVLKLASINASFKRLAKREGFRLEFVQMNPACGKLAHYFVADSREAALKHVAEYLQIPYPMTTQAFYEHGCAAVFANFTTQIYPLVKK